MIIGIDPGVSGGIAALSKDSSNKLQIVTYNMPGTDRDLFELLMSFAATGPCIAVVEDVHAMPQSGRASMFKFGKQFGSILMALTAAKIPYILVQPQKWQKAMGCMTKGNKNVTKQAAQQRWPGQKFTHATADAALIAAYAFKLDWSFVEG